MHIVAGDHLGAVAICELALGNTPVSPETDSQRDAFLSIALTSLIALINRQDGQSAMHLRRAQTIHRRYLRFWRTTYGEDRPLSQTVRGFERQLVVMQLRVSSRADGGRSPRANKTRPERTVAPTPASTGHQPISTPVEQPIADRPTRAPRPSSSAHESRRQVATPYYVAGSSIAAAGLFGGVTMIIVGGIKLNQAGFGGDQLNAHNDRRRAGTLIGLGITGLTTFLGTGLAVALVGAHRGREQRIAAALSPVRRGARVDVALRF